MTETLVKRLIEAAEEAERDCHLSGSVPRWRKSCEDRDEAKVALETFISSLQSEIGELREALRKIGEAPDWATTSYLRSQARTALKRAGFERCLTCNGEFDEGEWNASSECPECETPKIATLTRSVSGEGKE